MDLWGYNRWTWHMWIFHQQTGWCFVFLCFPLGWWHQLQGRDSPIRDSARVGARMSIGAGMSTVLYIQQLQHGLHRLNLKVTMSFACRPVPIDHLSPVMFNDHQWWQAAAILVDTSLLAIFNWPASSCGSDLNDAFGNLTRQIPAMTGESHMISVVNLAMICHCLFCPYFVCWLDEGFW